MDDLERVFTQDEAERLIMARLHSGPASEEELKALIDWGRDARVRYALLSLALKGKAYISRMTDQGEPEFYKAD